MPKLSFFMRFSWGKILLKDFAPCKKIDISQLWIGPRTIDYWHDDVLHLPSTWFMMMMVMMMMTMMMTDDWQRPVSIQITINWDRTEDYWLLTGQIFMMMFCTCQPHNSWWCWWWWWWWWGWWWWWCYSPARHIIPVKFRRLGSCIKSKDYRTKPGDILQGTRDVSKWRLANCFTHLPRAIAWAPLVGVKNVLDVILEGRREVSTT